MTGLINLFIAGRISSKRVMQHDNIKHTIKHFAYAGGWKKFEPLWNFMIKTKGLTKCYLYWKRSYQKQTQAEKTKDRHPFPLLLNL